jgi:glycosyltransferase involved in cell wall biosynthesis
MITVGEVWSGARSLETRAESEVLSVVHLCDGPDVGPALEWARSLPSEPAYPVEHVLVRPAPAGDDGALPPAEQPAGDDVRVVVVPDVGLPGLAFDAGLAASRGRWLWFRPAAARPAPRVFATVLQALRREPSASLLWLQPPEGGPGLGVDSLHNGLCPAVESLVWRRDVFRRWGCFDPHIVVGPSFAYEMLVRTSRHLRVSALPVEDAPAPALRPRDLADVVLYAQARAIAPELAGLAHCDIDDLSSMEAKYGTEAAWRIYLERVLPHLYRYRHVFPPALPIWPQSRPRARMLALFTKVQYETSNELTFWNYQQRFGGGRRFGFSYLQSEMLRGGEGPELSIAGIGRVDVLVSTRTADAFNTALVTAPGIPQCATAYMTDDDMLSFHEYGGSFSSFRPGDPHYEAMVHAIRAADVVIGFSDQIRTSTCRFNPRYVRGDDSVPLELLPPPGPRPDAPARPFHFGYAGGGYRTAEFALLRPAVERILDEYGDGVRFSFWGIRPEDLPLDGRVEYVPFSAHYHEYLERLAAADFHAMLVPLMSAPAPKRAKNPNKFMEAAIANAVGLYSDVPSYQVVRDGVTGLKVAESTEAWYQAMKAALDMPPDSRDTMRRAAIEFVRQYFSTPSLAWTTELGVLAATLHHKTRLKRHDDGRPMIAFFFPCVLGTGGGEIQLWRRFEQARNLGFRLIVAMAKAWEGTPDATRVCRYLDSIGVEWEFVVYNAFYITPDTDDILPKPWELDSLRDFFGRRSHRISLAHSLAFLPAVGQVCSEFGVPHVASIYGVADDYELPGTGLPFKYCDLIQSDSLRYARKWSRLLKCDWICCRETVPAELFEVGFDRLFLEPGVPEPGGRMRFIMMGTFMARKNHLNVIRSLAWLDNDVLDRVELHLYGGVDAYPDYGRACRQAREEARMRGATVEFHGHVRDLVTTYRGTDVVLSVSSFESFPSAIKEATAAGCLVVASTAGGIGEMMVDGVNCFLVDAVEPADLAAAITRVVRACPEERLRIRRRAYTLAREEFHPRRTLHDLALGYNLAVEASRRSRADGAGASR